MNEKGYKIHKSRLKNAFREKEDFFQSSDGLPEKHYGNETVLYKGSASERSDFFFSYFI